MRGPFAVFVLGLVVFLAGLTPLWLRQDRSAPIPDDLESLAPVLQERIRTYVQAVRQQPADPEAHGQLGLLYEAHGYHDLAKLCYANAIAIAESNPRWRYHWAVLAQESGDVQAAESNLREVIAKRPDYAPAHQRLGLLLLDRNALQEAGYSFERVVQLRPDEVQGYIGLARVRLRMHEDREAVDVLSKALTIAPDRPEVHYLLGRAYRGLGRVEQGKVELARGGQAQQPVVRDPWRQEMLPLRLTRWLRRSRANDLLAEGQVAAAAEELEGLLADYPDNQNLMNDLAVAYSRLQRDDEAMRLLTDALRINEDHVPTHVNLAMLLGSRRDLARALEHAEKATVLAPKNAGAFSTKAKILLHLRRPDEALASFRQSEFLDPSDPTVHSAIGLTLVQLQRWEEAIKAYEEAVRLDTRSVRDRLRLGLLYRQAGRVEDARATLRAALQIEPDNEQVRQLLQDIEASSRDG